jgi:hypothetical protein
MGRFILLAAPEWVGENKSIFKRISCSRVIQTFHSIQTPEYGRTFVFVPAGIKSADDERIHSFTGRCPSLNRNRVNTKFLSHLRPIERLRNSITGLAMNGDAPAPCAPIRHLLSFVVVSDNGFGYLGVSDLCQESG